MYSYLCITCKWLKELKIYSQERKTSEEPGGLETQDPISKAIYVPKNPCEFLYHFCKLLLLISNKKKGNYAFVCRKYLLYFTFGVILWNFSEKPVCNLLNPYNAVLNININDTQSTM